MNLQKSLSCAFFIALSLLACNEPENSTPATTSSTTSSVSASTTFRLLSPTESGIEFSNQINEDYVYNILNFEYLYNGGGVAVGDINNDGLPDLYFSGTFVSNRLYLNKGNLKFEDITQSAGVAAAEGFKTGVTMADINSDGHLDLFVCRTSKSDDGQKNNLVFINNGDLTFTESAQQYGLADNSNSNHANFFDYDLDGDLDLYLLNHRLGFKDAVRLRLVQDESGAITRQTNPMTEFESDRLYRNNGNGTFTDVSASAGIVNSAFGLSATVADLNMDGYPDVYVANDYIEPDYVYINNGDGTFTDRYFDYIRHSSQNSMGSDVNDFNNDGLPDIVVLDMIAEDHVRYKQLMNIMQLERYETLVKYGYGHQVARNVLQMNNGNGTFSEVGQLAGISNTDWSWGAFFADFDNDGFKDIYIGNGYKRDVTNLDYMTYTRDSIEKTGGINKKRFPDLNTFLDLIPSTKLQNYMFRNRGDMTFENVSDSWGLKEKTFSNGTAFGDFDGDGDLDLVVNNIDDPAFIYENQSTQKNYLQLTFKGGAKNTLGIGAKVRLEWDNGALQYQQLTANRGFFSASQPILHFGLGAQAQVDRVVVEWWDGKTQILENVKGGQKLEVDYKNATNASPSTEASASLFREDAQTLGLSYTHKENDFQDFNQERLLPHQLSQLGPQIATGDLNGDGREDCFVGGAAGSVGAIFLQNANGTFTAQAVSAFNADLGREDVDAVFFDADGDQDLDLYVVSGGKTFPANSPMYQDRLYLNDGQGNLSVASDRLPKITASGSCVTAHDYDGDNDLDLFVGGRVTPGAYPVTPRSYVLQNNGGTFKDVTAEVASSFEKAGMITDIIWANIDSDPAEEMLVSGEWMGLRVYQFDGKILKDISQAAGFGDTEGWWNCLAVSDFDGDGDLDLVAGNLGLNTRLKASNENPLAIFAKDFDSNGAVDAIFAYHKNGSYYPFAGRDMMVKQISKVKKNYPRYAKYAKATMNEIFANMDLESAQKLVAHQLTTAYFENLGDGKFRQLALPTEVQLAPVKHILADDFNGDNKQDLLLVGNDYGAEPETGVYDAFNGLLLLGNGQGGFDVLPNAEHGFWASAEARDLARITLANGKVAYLVANNDGPLQAFVKQ